MRTAEGRETGTGYTKLDAPLPWPQEVGRVSPIESVKLALEQVHWGWEATESNQESPFVPW